MDKAVLLMALLCAHGGAAGLPMRTLAADAALIVHLVHWICRDVCAADTAGGGEATGHTRTRIAEEALRFARVRRRHRSCAEACAANAAGATAVAAVR